MKPPGAFLLQTLMEIPGNWAAGGFPLNAFAEADQSIPEEHSTTRVTAVMLWTQTSATLLGPYVEELLTSLTTAAEGNTDIDRQGSFYIGHLSSDGAIQRGSDLASFPDEIHPSVFDELIHLLTPFEWNPARTYDQLLIPNPGHYAALQQALALNRFQRVPSSPFPRAHLNKGGAKGFAEMRPHAPTDDLTLAPEEINALAQRMWAQREELSDKDADTMDAISAAWIQSARAPSDRVPIYIDDLIRLRGLQPKKSGGGRRGGFEATQRKDLWRCLLHLQDLWIDLAEVTFVEEDASKRRRRKTRSLQSRAFVITDRVGQRRIDGTMDVEVILVTPGEAFGRFLLGPGRQLALLSSQALRYDPLRRRLEKRLARYLAWQWRVGAKLGNFVKTYTSRTLLEETGHKTERPRYPNRIKDRLEQALDQLHQDDVIAAWQYDDGWREDALPRKGWFRTWLKARIQVEAPDAIKLAYRKLARIRPTKAKILPGQSWGARIRQKRTQLHLSQMQAAEQIGTTQAAVSQIERGQRTPRHDLRQKLEKWLRET